MAKRKVKGKSRSEHIRDYLRSNPEASPKQIVEGLAEKGVKVSVGLASNVKYTSGPGGSGKKKTVRKKAKAGKPAGKKTAGRRGSAGLTATDLLEAKHLADQVGGIQEARAALDALEKLQ